MPRPKKNKEPDVEVLDDTDILDTDTSESEDQPEVSLSFRSGIKNTSFDIFAGTKALKEENSKHAFRSMADAASYYLPVPWMALQYVIGRVGIPMNTVIEFIGAEGVGKSSLIKALLGGFVENNVPCCYINSEPKIVDPDWRMRIYSRSPETSEKIDSVINYEELYTLEDMKEYIHEWVTAQREVIPVDVPIVIVVDSITNLMNPAEAEAAGWDPKLKKFTASKDVSKKPGVTAKWMHEWKRTISPRLQQDNITIILVSGQNQDMNTAASPFIPATAIAKRNKTRAGGNAINQIASLQFTLTKMSDAKRTSTAKASGKNICLYGAKNSYGPTGREITYTIWDNRADNFKGLDVPGKYLASPIDMDVALCVLLIEHKVFGLNVAANKYTSEELELFKASASDVVAAIYAKPERILKAAKALSIYGYETT